MPIPQSKGKNSKMGSQLVSTDAKNKLEDLSGITIQPGQNPYQAFITACGDDHVMCTSSSCQVLSRASPRDTVVPQVIPCLTRFPIA